MKKNRKRTQNQIKHRISMVIANGKCISCGKNKGNFPNDESREEYALSGLCYGCQKRIFNL